jgi:hypothetical protein
VVLRRLSVEAILVMRAIGLEEVGDVQQAGMTVKGGHNPDVIVVERGMPVRLLKVIVT